MYFGDYTKMDKKLIKEKIKIKANIHLCLKLINIQYS
jgi:hypothetical protein